MKIHGSLAWCAGLAGVLPATGCGAVAIKTNTLSDERILSETGGVQGVGTGRTANGGNGKAGPGLCVSALGNGPFGIGRASPFFRGCVKGEFMTRFVLSLALATGLPAAANAATCEQSFVKKGNPVTGLRFIATTSVPGMSPASAVGQLNGIVAAKGYDILAVEQASGTMLIEQPQTGKARPFPIEIAADAAGNVRMEAKLRAAMGVPEAAAKAEMCGILAQLKGGKAGEALAAEGMRATTAPGAPIRMSVLRFSQDITGEADKNSAAVPLRYNNKSFTLYGPVGYVGPVGDSYRVEWKLVSNVLTDIVPGRSSAGMNVNCVLAKGHGPYALQLKPGKHAELTGTFDRLDHGLSLVWLKDCRPVK